MALLLARSTRTIVEKLRTRASLKYDRDVGLLKGGVVRYVATGFSKVVNDNNGLGWLADGIRGQENGLRNFNAGRADNSDPVRRAGGGPGGG